MFRHLTSFMMALIIVLVLAYGLSFFIPNHSDVTSRIGFMENEHIADFSYRVLDGGLHSFNESQGKIVIINFWASWCSPCVKEAPSLIDLVKRMNGNLQLIAISGDSNLNDVNAFLSAFPLFDSKNIHFVWDQDRSLMKKFGVDRLPETFIFNSDGLFKRKISGEVDWSSNESVELFKKLNSQK